MPNANNKNSAMDHDESSLALQYLKKYYGFNSFRDAQATIIDQLINGEDLLVLMPTGGGKSLCYQIPALIRDGVGIIVSPLISLMEDQVTAMQQLGIKAAFYNSSLSANESTKVLNDLRTNKIDLLYIAPERLLRDYFLEDLTFKVALFAIDEAHCISQWGHDFRPEYRELGCLKRYFPSVPIIALTATADEQTREDIINKLNYSPKIHISSFNRANIYYQVVAKENPVKQIINYLEENKTQAGIIYCLTRESVETLAEELQAAGFAARGYHAGMPHATRKSVKHDFRFDNINIVVATIAFGMGIDKPNVRFVIHYDLPRSIESYYQETGRAGRDGTAAMAILLYSPQEAMRLRSLIQQKSEALNHRVEVNKFSHMLAFVQASNCRRDIVLRYFGEVLEKTAPKHTCCDICKNPPQLIDATEEAQKFLSCIYRLRQNFGFQHVVEVLRGSAQQKILQFNHQTLSTYGIGKDHPAAYWRQIGWQLIQRDYFFQDFRHFNVLKLRKSAIKVLKGEEEVFLILPSTSLKPKERKKKPAAFSNNSPLFEKLRALRRKIATAENKPPFMIFSDATLHDMISMSPKNLEDMQLVNGVGQYKLERYGAQFLEEIL